MKKYLPIIFLFLWVNNVFGLEAPPQKKVLFIVNPFSGVSKKKELSTYIRKYLDRKHFTYDVVYTKRPKHASELTKAAVEQHYDLVVAVGGDGTVNEVAKELIGKKTALGIIPMGSGNGLARHLHIPLDPIKAIKSLNEEYETWMDTVRINDDLFINVAGCGFDAKVSNLFSQFKHRGLASYLKIILQNFAEYQSKEYQLTIDGKPYNSKAFLMSFANSTQYGNNLVIAPWARIDDGYLDITILKEFPSYAIPMLTFLLFRHKLDQSKYIEHIRCKDVIIEGEDLHFHIDGEPFQSSGPIHIQMMPSSLKIYIPSPE